MGVLCLPYALSGAIHLFYCHSPEVFPIDPAVFGYIRISQAAGESGLATQRRTLNDHGLRDDRIFTDVASSRNMRRPSWTELRGMLNLGDTVVVPRIDRLARNLTEGLKTIEELHAQGINIRSLAEWERDTIRDRIRAGVDRAAGGGENRGKASGAVIGEGEGRQGFPGERRVGQRSG